MALKISLKLKTAEGMPKQKIKGIDTGHIRSIIPIFIKFLHMLGYDSVTDVMIVTGRIKNTPYVYGKNGRLLEVEQALIEAYG